MTEKEKEAQIAQIEEAYENALAEIAERRRYRMENYYNCVDDYSFGGLCDKADEELKIKLRTIRDIRIEQVQSGGHVVCRSKFYRLVSESGDTCDGIRCGHYGRFFAIDRKCVSLPKRIATLNKKGYRLFCVNRVYECTFSALCKNGAQWRTMTLVDERVEETNEIPHDVREKPYIDYQYDVYFTNE